MLLRIVLLFGINLLTSLNESFFKFDTAWIKGGVSGQAVIIFLGGLFLLYKSTKEIHEKIEDKGHDAQQVASGQSKSLRAAIIQITVINIVFSFDSILTAIGMTNGISENPTDALIIM